MGVQSPGLEYYQLQAHWLPASYTSWRQTYLCSACCWAPWRGAHLDRVPLLLHVLSCRQERRVARLLLRQLLVLGPHGLQVVLGLRVQFALDAQRLCVARSVCLERTPRARARRRLLHAGPQC